MTERPASVHEHDVPVRDGSLHLGVWGPDDAEAPAVLAIHGITASHLAWGPVATALPGVRIVAPDLRGRGLSAELPGPYGMAQHADDLARALDALDIERLVVAGHSMGAFVALVLAHRHPDRVSELLLVDGGLPLEMPEGFTLESAERALGPAAERLAMTFESREAYRSFWRAHPAFAEDWSPAVEAYVDYDLAGEPPLLRSRTSAAAMRADSVELYGGAAVLASVTGLAHPATLMLAPRGLQNETPGLYAPVVVERWAAQLPELRIVEIADTNHYTILMGERGAAAVAAELSNALEEQNPTETQNGATP